jgi:hypothetical protein
LIRNLNLGSLYEKRIEIQKISLNHITLKTIDINDSNPLFYFILLKRVTKGAYAQLLRPFAAG